VKISFDWPSSSFSLADIDSSCPPAKGWTTVVVRTPTAEVLLHLSRVSTRNPGVQEAPNPFLRVSCECDRVFTFHTNKRFSLTHALSGSLSFFFRCGRRKRCGRSPHTARLPFRRSEQESVGISRDLPFSSLFGPTFRPSDASEGVPFMQQPILLSCRCRFHRVEEPQTFFWSWHPFFLQPLFLPFNTPS